MSNLENKQTNSISESWSVKSREVRRGEGGLRIAAPNTLPKRTSQKLRFMDVPWYETVSPEDFTYYVHLNFGHYLNIISIINIFLNVDNISLHVYTFKWFELTLFVAMNL